jgi:glycosyltransferase involved in cell wall biosynthesis
MKPGLTVLYGQAPELSTSFQTRELARHLAPWFEIEHRELPRGTSGVRYQFTRFFKNYFTPILRRPRLDFVLYGNDGLIDLRRWSGRRLLYWYDAPADWSKTEPQNFQQRLRCRNVVEADEVFAVSAAQVRVAKALRPGREESVHYLPVGVDCDVFDPSRADRSGARRRFGFSDDDIVIGYLGYLGAWQNRFAGEALLEAAPFLNDPLIRFLIIGDGPALPRWKEMVRRFDFEKRFVFAGFVPQADLPSTIMAADICVDTLEPGFHSEARSETKLKQYMAMARACVATDIGENPADLENGAAGLLAAPAPESLAKAITRLAENRSERTILGETARARAYGVYDWQKLARRMVEVLRIPTV